MVSVKDVVSATPRGTARWTHVMVQTLNDSGIDEDAGGDTVEDADGEERRARVWIVCRVESDTDGDANRGNELRESGN